MTTNWQLLKWRHGELGKGSDECDIGYGVLGKMMVAHYKAKGMGDVRRSLAKNLCSNSMYLGCRMEDRPSALCLSIHPCEKK